MTYKQNKTCCLVLAASFTEVPYSKFKKKPYLLLNAGIKLALEKISTFYESQNIEVFVVTDIENIDILDIKAFENCNFIHIKNTSSLFNSLKLGLSELKTFDNIIINPIQVIPSVKLKLNTISIGLSLSHKENWSAVKFNGNNASFLFKDYHKSEGIFSYPFTGRINCEKEHINKALLYKSYSSSNDLALLAEYLYQNYDYNFQKEKWLDLTHNTLLTKTKIENLSSRNFHGLVYCDKTNSIIKRHTSGGSFQNIILFYKLMPNNIKRFFPALINANTSPDNSSYAMEYIPFPTLAELFLHGELGYLSWEKIILKLKNIYDEIYLSSSKCFEIDSGEFYAKKLKARKLKLEKLIMNNKFYILKKILSEKYIVNGLEFPPLLETYDELYKKLISKYPSKLSGYFGHGDLCFNNILIDPYSFTIKLIDPKAASNSEPDKLGFVPPLYDIAKLNHSFIGLYDSIISNMYSLKNYNNSYQLNIYRPTLYSYISKKFIKVFLDSAKSKEEINLLTSNLFLSMLPLHSEDPERMATLGIIGNFFFHKSSLFLSDFLNLQK